MVVDSVLSNENTLFLSGWMVNQLNLSGNELIVYGIIYGLSQYGIKNGFYEEIEIIKKWTGISSDEEIEKIFKNLIEKKIIIKNTVITKDKKINYFLASKIKKNDNNEEKKQINEIMQKIKEEMGFVGEPFQKNIAEGIIKAAQKYSLNKEEILEYIEWSVKQCTKGPKEDIFSYYYNYATKAYNVAKYVNYKIDKRKKKEETEDKEIMGYLIECPVCGLKHDALHSCPNCELPENASGTEIENYKIRFNLPKKIKKQLDFELLQHKKNRPDVMNFDISIFNKWKKEEDDIFQKYKNISE